MSRAIRTDLEYIIACPLAELYFWLAVDDEDVDEASLMAEETLQSKKRALKR